MATCIQIDKDLAINGEMLHTWRARYLDTDDVFHPSFLQEIIFTGTDDVHLESDTKTVLEDWKTLKVNSVPHLGIPNGPCYVVKGVIHSAWRVYQDPQLSFLQAVWPSIEDKRQAILSIEVERIANGRSSTYIEINAAGNAYRGHGVAVPARSSARDFGQSTPCHNGSTKK